VPEAPCATGSHPRRTGTRGGPLAGTAEHGPDGGLETGSLCCQEETGLNAC